MPIYHCFASCRFSEGHLTFVSEGCNCANHLAIETFLRGNSRAMFITLCTNAPKLGNADEIKLFFMITESEEAFPQSNVYLAGWIVLLGA